MAKFRIRHCVQPRCTKGLSPPVKSSHIAGLLRIGQGGPHRRKLRRAAIPGSAGDGMRLQQPAQNKDLGNPLRRQVRQGKAPTGAVQIAFAGQLHQRLAHRHPADPHLGGNRVIDQPRVRTDLAAQKTCADGFMNADSVAVAGHLGDSIALHKKYTVMGDRPAVCIFFSEISDFWMESRQKKNTSLGTQPHFSPATAENTCGFSMVSLGDFYGHAAP